MSRPLDVPRGGNSESKGARAVSHMKWFRSDHSMISDGGVHELSDFEFRVLFSMMSLASQSPPLDRIAGALTSNPSGKPLPLKSIHFAVWTAPDEQATAEAVASLIGKGFVERRTDGAWRLLMWWQQYLGDTSTPRSRKHRANAKHSSGDDRPHERPEPKKASTSLPDENRSEQSRTKGNVAGNVSPQGFVMPSDDTPMP